jgi:hypothetical protein
VETAEIAKLCIDGALVMNHGGHASESNRVRPS